MANTLGSSQFTGRTKLKNAHDPYSEPFVMVPTDPKLSPFTPKAWVKGVNSVTELIDLLPTRSLPVTWGTSPLTFTWEITKQGDRLQHLDLVLDRSAITYGGGSTPIPCVSDHELYAMTDSIVFRYNNRQLWRIPGDKLMLDMMCDTTECGRGVIAKQQGGFLTKGQRSINANERLERVLRIPHPFRTLSKSLSFTALPSKLYLDWNIKAIGSAHDCQGLSSPVCTLNNLYIRSLWHHLEQDDRMADFHKSRSGGIVYKTVDFNYQMKEPVTAASLQTQTVKILVPNLKQDIFRIQVAFRNKPDADYTSGESAAGDQFRFLKAPARVYLTENGSQITEKMTLGQGPNINFYLNAYQVMMRQALAEEYGIPGRPIVEFYFCPIEFMQQSSMFRDNCYGSLRFSAYSNVQLVLEFDADPTSASYPEWSYDATNGIYVDVYADHHQLISNVGGDLKRYIE